MPTLVTFADLADPSTLQVVGPAEFPSVFGPEYRLDAVYIELTTNPITRVLERKIAWIRDYHAARIARSALRSFTTAHVYAGPVELYWRE
jgi:hypothetical protein